jgi:hypothetical protein
MGNFPGRTDNDETWTCVSCCMTVMSRGADVANWKGVQLTDDPIKLSWYCDKAICQEGLFRAIKDRTRELRIRAGLPPDPPPKKKKPKTRRLSDFIQTGNVFAPPPGGFAAMEKVDAEAEEQPAGDDAG